MREKNKREKPTFSDIAKKVIMEKYVAPRLSDAGSDTESPVFMDTSKDGLRPSILGPGPSFNDATPFTRLDAKDSYKTGGLDFIKEEPMTIFSSDPLKPIQE